jgi:hypothetical protein
MAEEMKNPSLFNYLDRALGDEGIKTTSKFDVTIDSKTAVTIGAIGMGLIVFNHLLGIGLSAVLKSK